MIAFGQGVDEVSLAVKKARGARPEQELYRAYLETVMSGTDELGHRKQREEMLRGLLAPLFEAKDERRLFSAEQRRLLWNSTDQRKCEVCGKLLTWTDFTIDHVQPHSKGGRTDLLNAALLCRSHNAQKGNRARSVRKAARRRTTSR